MSIRLRLLLVLLAIAAVSIAVSIASFLAVSAKVGAIRDAFGANQSGLGSSLDQIGDILLVGLVAAIFASLVMLVIAGGLVDRWVVRPLRRLVAVATKVEAGEQASFGLNRADEVGQLGSALETMRTRMSERDAALAADARQASVINRFTDAASSTEDEQALASAALDALCDLSAATAGVVHLTTPKHDVVRQVAGAGRYEPREVSVADLDNCPGVRRRGLYTVPDLSRAVSVACPVYPATQGAIACLPLRAGTEVVGVAHLHWPEPEAPPLAIRTAMTRIGDQAGMSVANRRLLIELQGGATTDAGTALANVKAFDEQLERLMLGRRDGHELAILLADIDEFRDFNERNGSAAGDEGLRFFARTLDACLRDGDLAARYGGEEFAVLLPGLDVDQALEVAERIRARIEATPLPVGNAGAERMTVSLGVASAPHDGTNRVDLLRAADEALYEAKQQGRNRVVAATELIIPSLGPDEGGPLRGQMITINRELRALPSGLAATR